LVGHHRHAVADVGEYLATPIAGNLRDKLLTKAGRAARVGQERHVTIAGINLWIPAVTPVVIPRALRSAVNQDDKRIFSPRIEIRRLHDPSSDFRARATRPRH